MELNKLIGSRISFLRKEHGLTQEQLSEKLDISVKHCSAVERGLSRLSLEKLIEVCNIFNVSLDYLIRETTPCATYDYLSDNFSSTAIHVLHSNDAKELKLLNEYLVMYARLRNMES